MRTCIGLIAAKVHDKAMKLHAIASLGVSGTDNQGCTTTTPSHQTGGGNGTLTSSHNGSLQAISNGQLPANGADNGYSPSQQTTVTQLSNGDDLQAENDRTPENRDDKSGPYWDLHASNTNNNADEVVATQVRIVSESIPANTKHSHNFLYNVGPTSKTLGRRCINVMKMLCVCLGICAGTVPPSQAHTAVWFSTLSATLYICILFGIDPKNCMQIYRDSSLRFFFGGRGVLEKKAFILKMPKEGPLASSFFRYF